MATLAGKVLSFVKAHKVPVFWLVLGLGLGIWLAQLFRPASGDAAAGQTRSEKKLLTEIADLQQGRTALQGQVNTLYAQVSKDSAEIARLRVLVRQTSAVIVTKNTNIEKIRKQYETINRIDSISSNELVQLFSNVEIPAPGPVKRR